MSAILMERQASIVPRVGGPLRRGLSGFLWRTAAVLTIGTMACALIPNRSRKRRIAVAALGTLGSALDAHERRKNRYRISKGCASFLSSAARWVWGCGSDRDNRRGSVARRLLSTSYSY